MKNIYLIPTDKPSSLYLGNNGNFVFGMIQTSIQSRNDDFTNQHLYITSDEKFNRDEYVTDGVEVIKATPKLVDAQGLVDRRDWRKIILTTDGNLIKDGVQVIDDEFLQWYIKNPSCESVEIEKQLGCVELDAVCDFGEISCPNAPNCLKNKYKIIISKGEHKTDYSVFIKQKEEEFKNFLKKRETLEEAAVFKSHHSEEDFIRGGRWQQEQEQDKNKFSEEDMREAFENGVGSGKYQFEYGDNAKGCMSFEMFIEQFKKK